MLPGDALAACLSEARAVRVRVVFPFLFPPQPPSLAMVPGFPGVSRVTGRSLGLCFNNVGDTGRLQLGDTPRPLMKPTEEMGRQSK